MMEASTHERKEDLGFNPRLRCGLCDLQGNLCCSACLSIFYCTGDHQKEGWKQHKIECKKIKNLRSSTLDSHQLISEITSGLDCTLAVPGIVVKRGSDILVHYRTRFLNGFVFDDTCEQYGLPPVRIKVGSGNVLPGIDFALLSMLQGGFKEFILMPEAAYKRDDAWMNSRPAKEEPVPFVVYIKVLKVL